MLQLATLADREGVNAIALQIHDLHVAWRPDIFCASEEPYPKEKFLEDIRSRLVYVAKIDGLVAGYVVLAKMVKDGPGVVSRKLMRLESICVEESIRGNGIGKTMVEEVRILAKAFGCSQLILGVHAENDYAVGFYQKCGFRIRTINMDMQL